MKKSTYAWQSTAGWKWKSDVKSGAIGTSSKRPNFAVCTSQNTARDYYTSYCNDNRVLTNGTTQKQ